MRPLRLVILLTCFIALPMFLTFISLVTAHPRNGDHVSTSSSRSSRLRALFNFQTPASLFTPSAMISLTDDNSTFFIAKPADFGPNLPTKGLNGQLWIGMGFTEDLNREDGVLITNEGELGCSDVPGWDGSSKRASPPPVKESQHESVERKKSDSPGFESKAGHQKDVDKAGGEKEASNANPAIAPEKDDGTDDYLHHPLPESGTVHTPNPARPQPQENSRRKSKLPAHADIQSLQESAEIAGKVVLLSRGGCGFLEKVKWAQRRGAIAVIVGDNARHGSLLTMYGRGDTSNITIPSVFTSHTTAHLLSSLMPPEASADLKDSKQSKPKATLKSDANKPKTENKEANKKMAIEDHKTPAAAQVPMSSTTESQSRSWVRSLMHVVGLGHDRGDAEEDTRRPPSSGNIDWVLVEDFEEEDSKSDAARKKSTGTSKADKSTPKDTKTPLATQKHADDFVIGEQDWRDPDLLKPDHKLAEIEAEKKESSKKSQEHKNNEHASQLKGGSITPGSGEYNNPLPGKPTKGSHRKSANQKEKNSGTKGWFSWTKPLHTDGHEHIDPIAKPSKQSQEKVSSNSKTGGPSVAKSAPSDKDNEHEGLWITLTPTSMSTSPFLDTLLVLVVSPLVTLTVVYGMLLLRSRIRRRRWRAPKSVVERLPVRTYHTMSTSAVSSQASPESSSPTTPLLRASASTRPRPRSRTASSVPTTNSESFETPTLSSTPLEKNTPANPWRRRYTGRQVECVVCLEEYVDGQSRVMSLPCGHEFHAECM